MAGGLGAFIGLLSAIMFGLSAFQLGLYFPLGWEKCAQTCKNDLSQLASLDGKYFSINILLRRVEFVIWLKI